MNAIEFRAVKFTYHHPEQAGGAVQALDGITVSIAKGEFVAVLGKKGAGKSSFLKLCNALLLPTDGAVSLHGIDTRDAARLQEIRSRSGMLFQDPESQIIGATVAEDVAFGPENLGLPPRLIRERVQDALQAVALVPFQNSATHLLSDPQKVRLSLAGVLALQPDCLLIDEATALLGAEDRKEMVALLRTLSRERGVTVLLATRGLEEATGADRIIVLDEGKVSLELPSEGATHPLPSQGATHPGSEAPGERVSFLTDFAGRRYLHGGSILHRMDPRMKIAATFLLMTAALLLETLPALLLLLFITLDLASSAGKPLQQSLRGLKLILYLSAVAVAVNLLSIQGTPLMQDGLLSHVSREAVGISAAMLLRIFLLATAASLLTFTTPPLALADGLERLLKPLNRIGIRVSEGAMMLLIALRFLPVIAEEAERLILARPERSGDFNKGNLLQRARSYLPLFIPLFAGVARRGDALATAMDARCYRGGAGRTRMNPLQFSRVDFACAAGTFVLLSMVALVENL